MNLDKILINRQVYNVLDMLGDIGGLQYALIIILTFIVMLFNLNTTENFLVSEMFQVIDAKTLMKKQKKIGFKNGKVTSEVERELYP